MIEEFKGSSGSKGGSRSVSPGTAFVGGAVVGGAVGSAVAANSIPPSINVYPSSGVQPQPQPQPLTKPEPVVTKKIVLPCIATTLGKNGEIMYLIDSNRNLVYCDAKGLFSLDVDYILNTFANERKPDVAKDRYNRNSYTNDCAKKEIELNGSKYLQEKPNASNLEKFILNEVRINGDILNKYNLTDISLNQFEGSRVFREPFDIGLSSQPPNYQKLNNNEKKRLACGLYYHFITEEVTFPESLTAYLKEEEVKPGYNEKNSIVKFNKDRGRDIAKWQINKLEEFQKRDIFTFKKPEQNKGLSGGAIAGIVLGVFGFFCLIIGGYLLYRKSKSSTSTSSTTASASASASASTKAAKTGATSAKTGATASAKTTTHIVASKNVLYGSA